MLKIWHKLSAIALVCVIAIALILFFFIKEQGRKLDFSTKELYGVEYIDKAGAVQKRLIDFRGMVFAYSKRGVGRKSKISKVVSEIDVLLNDLEVVDSNFGDKLNTSVKIKGVKKNWENVKNVFSADSRETVPHVDKLIADINGLIKHVGNTSNLVLDPNLDTNYLVNSIVNSIPNAATSTMILRDLLSAHPPDRPFSTEEVLKLSSLVSVVRSELDGIVQGMDVAIRQNPDVGSQIAPLVSVVKDVGDIFVYNVEDELRGGSGFRELPRTQIYEEGNLVVDGFFQFYSASTNGLKNLISDSVSSQKQTRLAILTLSSFAFVVIVILVFVISSDITRQIKSISTSLDQIRSGNFKARAEVLTKDELGKLAASLNIILEETISLTQSREERDKIQRSIRKLLEEVSDVATGDLTIQAEVTADMTGAIADAFNNMILQLRNIIGEVKTASIQVSASSSSVNNTMNSLMNGSEEQTAAIIETSSAMDEMSISVKQVSENARASAEVAELALHTSNEGSDAVEKTIDAMEGIKDHVQETAKRIKRLGESSQEIGETVRLINEIADVTRILALNASIQATTSGEAGRGFAVVAEEIERLAENAASATQRISTLTKTIQMETAEAVMAMEATTVEVINGSKLANEAGTALVKIENVTNKIAELIQSISEVAEQQANSTETVAASMNDIARITLQTTSGTRQVADEITNLSNLSEALSSSVSTFKLPLSGPSSPETHRNSSVGSVAAEMRIKGLMDEEAEESFSVPEG